MKIPVINNSRQKQFSIWGFIFFGLFTLILFTEDKIIEVFNNRLIWALGWILSIFFALVLLILAKFSRNYKVIGQLSISEGFVIIKEGKKIEIKQKIEDTTLTVNYYRGQEYFSIKSIYPYHDGRNNFILLNEDKRKFEILIENKSIYNYLKELDTRKQ